MIQILLHVMDVLSLLVIFWCAGAGVVAGHEVRCWRDLLIHVGLAGVMAFSFVGVIALLAAPPSAVPLWMTALHAAVAAVATGLYEYRFGIKRHARMLWDWLHGSHRGRNRPA